MACQCLHIGNQFMLIQTDQMVQVHHITVMNAVQSFQRIALSGKSPQTKKWYSYRLDLMARSLGETRLLLDVLEVDLIQYREFLERKKISPIHCMDIFAQSVAFSNGCTSAASSPLISPPKFICPSCPSAARKAFQTNTHS